MWVQVSQIIRSSTLELRFDNVENLINTDNVERMIAGKEFYTVKFVSGGEIEIETNAKLGLLIQNLLQGEQ